jgi:Flp pilus assembly pilin Flp
MKTDHPDRRLRHAVQLKATATKVHGGCRDTIVTDFSLDGCCISGFYATGEHLELRIRPIGTFQAQVRWAFAGKAGMRFTQHGPPARRSENIGSAQSGAAAIEYCITAALIALACIVALAGLGQQVGTNWNNVANSVSSDATISYNAS